MNYLMLNKDDITEVCGVISRKEVIKEIGEQKLWNILDRPHLHPFRGKYHLVEEKFEDNFKDEKVVIHESTRKEYFVTSKGEFYSVTKINGIKKMLTPFKKDDVMCVKIGRRDVSCKSVVAMVFMKGWRPGDVILHKDGNIKNCHISNLILVPKEQYAKVTGPKSRSQAVGLYENGSLIRKWSSARKCAKDMYCSYQTIMDYCNKKVKKPEFDVRWLKEKKR